MRVTIQVESGPKAGQRFLLRSGEQRKFGRAERADEVFADDDQMSGAHFKLLVDQHACHLDDLGSSNGTFVNDQPVTRVVVQSGDRIVAGQTIFHVDLEVATTGTTAVAVGSGQVVEAPAASGPATYHVEPCKSTLNCYRGNAEELPPAQLANMLRHAFQLTLILDPAKLESPLPGPLTPTEYLLDWLPEEARQGGTPILLTEDPQFGDLSAVQQAWGKDTLVAVCSEKDEPLPLEQIRRCAGVFAKPSVLRPQLCETVVEVVTDFMLEIEAVLVEDESPEAWLLYSACDLEPILQQFGLKKAQDTLPSSCPS